MCCAPDHDNHFDKFRSRGPSCLAPREAPGGLPTSPAGGSNFNSCVEVSCFLRTKPALSGSGPFPDGAGTYSISRQKEGR
jgi:hypothetical protein